MQEQIQQIYGYLDNAHNLILLALIVFGIVLRKLESINNRFIPAILLCAGMISGAFLVPPLTTGVFKGAIFAGLAVFFYELILKNIPFLMDFIENKIKKKLGTNTSENKE